MNESSAQPVLDSVTPSRALAGGAVRLRGTNLLSGSEHAPQVVVGDTLATPLFASPSEMIVTVPEGASGESITVTTEEGSAAIDITLATQLAANLHPVGNPAADARGNIYTTFSGGRGQSVPHSLYRIDDESILRPLAAPIMNPSGLALDGYANLYISSRYSGSVYRMTPHSELTTYAEGMGVATGLAFDADGSLYVGDRSGTIFKISPKREIFVFATLEPSVAAYHLAFSPNGNLYATGPTTSSNDCVYQIEPNGVVSAYFANLGRPQGLAFDIEGNLYVVACWRGQRGVLRIGEDKQCELVVAASNLVGLTFDPSGSMVLATTSSVCFLPWPEPGFIHTPELEEE